VCNVIELASKNTRTKSRKWV